MILSPDLRGPIRKSWGVFAGTLVICGAAVAWLADPGELPAQAGAAADKGRAASGPVDLAQRIIEARAANEHLGRTIETLKNGTGFTSVAPFVVPAGHPQPGQYFNEQLIKVQDELRPMARERSLQKYPERLGFELTEKVPDDKDAPYLLTMLQLTKKLGLIVLKTPRPVERFLITQPERSAIVTGPSDRPPLLREYPLRLEVRASLTDILWIVHQLALVEDGGYPLVVRGLSVKSSNINPKDDIQQLEAVIEVAGVQFLTEAERTAAPARTPVRGLGGMR